MNLIKIPILVITILIPLLQSKPNLVPYPQEISFQNASFPFFPCATDFKFLSGSFNQDIPQYYFTMLTFFYEETFPELHCAFKQRGKSFRSSNNHNGEKTLNIFVNNVEAEAPSYPDFSTNESYTLSLDENEWVMRAENYVGFLRGVETFMQLIESKNPDSAEYQISHYPINIKDHPSLTYRGVMMDTARHFIKISVLKHVLDGMLFHKLNVLHWHIVDEESFPLQLDSFPEITEFAAYSSREVYSKENVKEIVEYARYRGIRVIPEIDSPAHSLSWSFAPGMEEIAMRCPVWANYNGQLNPTLNKTYDVVKGILNDVSNLFPDSILHLGGDEVSYTCWESNPAIKAFMTANNLSSGVELQQYYKDREKTLLPQKKTAMFWMNDANFKFDPSDILQFWSSSDNYKYLANYTNQVVLSPYNFLYIDVGYGNVFGNPSWAPFITWKDIYNFEPFPKEIPRERVLGSEVTLWAEVNSDETTDNHLWSRTSAFAERVWNAEVKDNERDLVTRLYANEIRLVKRGFQPSPVSSQYCSKHVEICF